MMKKRMLSLVLAFCLAFGLLGAVVPVAMAEGEATSGSCGENVSWSFNEATGVLTITGSGAMDDYHWKADSPWYHLADSITSAKIDDRITHIGYNAFCDCVNMTDASIPAGVTSIGYSAFENCASLTKVVLPEGITCIPSWCFGRCSSLVSVEIPESVTRIELSAFTECTSLTEINLPSGITEIPIAAFRYCTSLTNVEIPDSVTSLGNDAFAYSGLTEVEIPATLTEISRGAFVACPNLKGIWVHKDNPNYSSDETGVLFNKTKTMLIQAPGALGGTYRIPDTVLEIDSDSFESCKNLKAVTIPDSVVSIYGEAFYQCESLQEVEIPSSVTTITSSAFAACSNLKGIWVHEDNLSYCNDSNGALFNKERTVLLRVPGGLSGVYYIPDSVETIGTGAFSYCGLLYDIYIPDSVTTIKNTAFAYCTLLYNLTIPESVTSMGGSTTYRCDGIQAIKFMGNRPNLNFDAFSGTTINVYYPDGNETFDPVFLENYGGKITWIPYTAHSSHSYGDWVTIVEASATMEGVEKRICTCGDVETRTTAKLPNPFTDINESDYFYAPVLWAASEGITTGTTPTTFAPNATCTRAQAITFLWRAMGCPEPTTTRNPFSDVNSREYYYKAVLWAVENGITTGTTATTFTPNASCTRAQVVTFLWRAMGCPEPTTTSHSFTDLKTSEYYYDAVLWAVENEITNGMTSTTFEPDRTCTRGQVVTFLYRDLVQ